MRVVINGESHEYSRGITFAELVEELGYGGRRIAIERNGEILPRSRYPDTRIEDGDTIEIVQAIGGG